jgi:hypothetical protein
MRRITLIATAIILGLRITACGSPDTIKDDSPVDEQITDIADKENKIDETTPTEEEGEVVDMIMKIGETKIQVAWEDNESVEALKELVSQEPLSIQMSMYGGFEQVGSIGKSLPRDDKQTTTEAGDIVLYSGNQIAVFYGSNSWAYTRLGHISDKNLKELTELLSNGNVTITIENARQELTNY